MPPKRRLGGDTERGVGWFSQLTEESHVTLSSNDSTLTVLTAEPIIDGAHLAAAVFLARYSGLNSMPTDSTSGRS